MKWIDRLQSAIKAFRLGSAVVEPADTYWGKDPEPFAPPVYGDYIATSSSVYACANLRARNLASLPLRAYRNDGTEVTDGPFIDLIKRVNPHWTYTRLMQMTELSLCLWGASFWILERGPSGKGVPNEIWWARPDRMRCIPDEKNYIAGWIYEWDNERLYFRPDEVLWSRYPNPLDEFAGLSPIAATRLAIDTARGALQSNHGIFKNGLQMAGVVTPNDNDTIWSTEQVKALGDSLERRFKGADKAHRVAVLGQSASFKTIGVSPKDAQFIELMKWTRSDVASVYAVPPELIGDHEHATYSNIEQAYKSFWTDCLIPEAALLAADITEQLCVLFPGVDYVAFDTTHISALQPDKASLADQATKWVAMGVPLNKVLAEIAPSMLPDEGGWTWGDTPMLMPMPQNVEQPTNPDNIQQATRAIKNDSGMTRPSSFIEYGSPEHIALWKAFDRKAKVLEARTERDVVALFERQRDELLAKLDGMTIARGVKTSKAHRAEVIKQFDDELWDEEYWNEEFSTGLAPAISQAGAMGGRDALKQLGVSAAFNLQAPDFQEFVLTRSQRFAERVNETTWNQLRTGIAQAIDEGRSMREIENLVENVMGDRIRSSAETIARTETIGALNGGSIQGAQQSGVSTNKTWIAALDQRTRETHIDAHERYQAQSIDMMADFEVGDGAGQAPGQIGLAEEDINCRCTIGWDVNLDEIAPPRRSIDPQAVDRLKRFTEVDANECR